MESKALEELKQVHSEVGKQEDRGKCAKEAIIAHAFWCFYMQVAGRRKAASLYHCKDLGMSKQ